jgi:hypothetical protein
MQHPFSKFSSIKTAGYREFFSTCGKQEKDYRSERIEILNAEEYTNLVNL